MSYVPGAQPDKRRVLIFSQRNIFSRALFRRPHYEFEDLISQIDSAEILAPRLDASNSRHTIARLLAFHAPVNLNPGIPEIKIKARYDLFLAICGAPGDLLMVNCVRNWRDNCAFSICLMDELWITQMNTYRHFLRLLENFDLVLLYYSNSVKPLNEQIGRKCVFLPPGTDTLLFSPYPNPPKRVIDVYSMGRKSEITHRSLLKMAMEKGMFYLYDTIAGDQSINLVDHRLMSANLAKRSRYFIVNPGLVDRPDIRGEQVEIGNRYFEGCAAGTVMLGEYADNGEFRKLFGWPDAVIHVPYDSSNIDTVIQQFDDEPERQERIRRMNVAQALLRHDWAYRWETMITAAGLKPMAGLLERKQQLRSLAEDVLPGEAMRKETPHYNTTAMTDITVQIETL